ncbi:intercellular adhesion molecule 4-like, partial [Sceloporus undulatus]|uniref:intercellular adhesion molecule 4-like n=1 Tax=Sceloporus undulatus TaxID=8520 RepID=UPI001C4B630E
MVSVITGTSEEVFEVTLSPQMVAVKQGVSVWLNCSFTCKSTPKVRLETSLRKGRVLRGPGWVSTQLQNITAQASLAHCFCTCEEKTKKATATILTYEQMDILLQKSSPSHSLHQAYNLTCRVIRITPVHNLTVTLLKGTKKVHSWRLQNITRPGPQNFNITHVIALRPHDHGQEAVCHVTLNHNAHEEALIATSSKLELKTP